MVMAPLPMAPAPPSALKCVLSILFERLYVLRCSLVHGGATWNSQVNRAQVQDGVNLLHSTVLVIVDLMVAHPELDLGAVAFPVVSSGRV